MKVETWGPAMMFVCFFCYYFVCFDFFVLFFVHGFSRTFRDLVKKSENNLMFIMSKYHPHVVKLLHGLNFLGMDLKNFKMDQFSEITSFYYSSILNQIFSFC